MHVALLQDTRVTHVNMKQTHAYINARIIAFKHNFPHILTINYGQILYRITLLPFRPVYRHDYYTLNHVKRLYLDAFHVGFLTFHYIVKIPNSNTCRYSGLHSDENY